MHISIIDPAALPDWDEWVVSHPKGSFFHTSVWARVLRESYGFFPCYVVGQKDGRIVAALPMMETAGLLRTRKGVSLPFTDFCGPLANGPEDFTLLLTELKATAHRKFWERFELRGGEEFLGNEPHAGEILTHDLTLDADDHQMLQSFRDSTKRNIQKAASSGVIVSHGTSIEGVRDFFKLNCLTRKAHGIPPQPWLFFENLWRNILNAGLGFITVASYEGRAIAANVYFVSGEKSLFKYGALDRKFRHLRPSNIVMWEGIRRCRDAGCKQLNLGRTELYHLGLLQFKRGFNCRESTIRYYRYNCKRAKFHPGPGKPPLRNIERFLFSRLPVRVLQLIGTYFYKFAG